MGLIIPNEREIVDNSSVSQRPLSLFMANWC